MIRHACRNKLQTGVRLCFEQPRIESCYLIGCELFSIVPFVIPELFLYVQHFNTALQHGVMLADSARRLP